MNGEQQFGSWTTEASPFSVEYSLVAIEEIRDLVSEGYQKFVRGGIEVGGVLYGRLEGNTVHIEAVREIQCEHAMGPSFNLSAKDHAALTEQFERDASDPKLEGCIPVGWFVSHTRSDIRLTEWEREFFDRYFSAPWHVALVVRPGRTGQMRAGFFIREADGKLKGDASYQEFDFPDRMTAIFDKPSMDRGTSDKTRSEKADAGRAGSEAPLAEGAPLERAAAADSSFARTLPHRANLAFQPSISPGAEQDEQSSSAPHMPVVPRQVTPAQFHEEEPPLRYGSQTQSRPGSNWSWLIVAVLIMASAAVAVVGLRVFGPRLEGEPLSVTVFERDGQLQIRWNRTATALRDAFGGSIQLVDGQETRSIPLDAKELASGNVTYARKSGDVQIRLVVESRDGSSSEAASRFLGAEPEVNPPAEPQVAQTEDKRDEQLRLYREENSRFKLRIEQLERTLVILRSRLGIQEEQQQ
jgi:proteasome lid subunit RPN8/RPN11